VGDVDLLEAEPEAVPAFRTGWRQSSASSMAYSVKSSSLHATRAAQRRCGCSGPGRSGRFGCSLMLQDGDLVIPMSARCRSPRTTARSGCSASTASMTLTDRLTVDRFSAATDRVGHQNHPGEMGQTSGPLVLVHDCGFAASVLHSQKWPASVPTLTHRLGKPQLCRRLRPSICHRVLAGSVHGVSALTIRRHARLEGW